MEQKPALPPGQGGIGGAGDQSGYYGTQGVTQQPSWNDTQSYNNWDNNNVAQPAISANNPFAYGDDAWNNPQDNSYDQQNQQQSQYSQQNGNSFYETQAQYVQPGSHY